MSALPNALVTAPFLISTYITIWSTENIFEVPIKGKALFHTFVAYFLHIFLKDKEVKPIF